MTTTTIPTETGHRLHQADKDNQAIVAVCQQLVDALYIAIRPHRGTDATGIIKPALDAAAEHGITPRRLSDTKVT